MAVSTSVFIPGSAGVAKYLNTILSGHSTPPDVAGSIGDFWLNLDTYVLTGPKQGDRWPPSGQPLIGAQGSGTASGNRIFWGEGPPSDALSPGADDAYFDVSTMTLYKAS